MLRAMFSNPQRTAIHLSLIAALLMLVGKWAAYRLTGSTAIFSDAAESVVHIAATAIAAFSLWYAGQPADAQHPYGHGRIAFFSAGLEGGLILIASLAILFTAIEALIRGPELHELHIGLAITGALAAVNLALGLLLVHTGRKHNSLVLVANGQHVLTDMWTSVGVVAGVAVVHFTGILWLDPVVAILMGLHILRSAVHLMQQSYSGLMDSADPATTELILESLRGSVDAGLLADFHQLRHRRIEMHIFMEVHLLLPGDLTVSQAHQQVNTVEDRLREALAGQQLHVTSHVEPEQHHEAHPDGHGMTDPFLR